MNVRYPDIKVQLVGTDGNAFAVIGKVTRSLREAGVHQRAIDEFTQEATNGDYSHLLHTAMLWVDVS